MLEFVGINFFFNYVTVEGKCESGWRHFQNKCYFFGDEERSQSDAENYCVGLNSHLTSVLDEDEESFIIGNNRRDKHIYKFLKSIFNILAT